MKTPVSLYRFIDGVGFTSMTNAVSGWTQAELLDDPQLWKTIIHPDDLARVLAAEEGRG